MSHRSSWKAIRLFHQNQVMPKTEKRRFRRRRRGQIAERKVVLYIMFLDFCSEKKRFQRFCAPRNFNHSCESTVLRNKGTKTRQSVKEMRRQRVQLCAPFTAEVRVLGNDMTPRYTVVQFSLKFCVQQEFPVILGSTGTHSTTRRRVVLDPSTRLLLPTLSKVDCPLFSRFLYLK